MPQFSDDAQVADRRDSGRVPFSRNPLAGPKCGFKVGVG